jgi:hypothetical protein
VVVFELSQDFAIGLLRVQGDEPARTAHAQEAHGTAAAVKGPAAVLFVEVVDQQDGGLVFGRKLQEREKSPAKTLIDAAVDPRSQESHDRIVHDQEGLRARQGLIQDSDEFGKATRLAVQVARSSTKTR